MPWHALSVSGKPSMIIDFVAIRGLEGCCNIPDMAWGPFWPVLRSC
jgi:hypothetical protein